MNKVTSALLSILFGLSTGAPASPEGQQPENVALQLTLEQVVRTVLQRAPEVLLADARAQRALDAVRETRSLNLPQLSAGTGLAYNNGFPLSLEGSAPSIFQVGVSKPLFSRKNRNLVLEAEELSRASRIGVDSVKDDLAAATALAYYELHRSRAQERILSAQLESAVSRQNLRQTQFQTGRARPLDVLLENTAVSEARQRLLVAHERAVVAEAQLKEWMGMPDASRIHTDQPALAASLLDLPVERLYAMALETSPDIRQAEAELMAREHAVEAGRSERYPQLAVVGQYALFGRFNNYQDYFNRFTRNNFLLGLSVQVPIFDGWRTNARVAQNLQQAAEARYRLQALKSELRLNLERCASELRVARGARDLAVQAYAAAAEGIKVLEALSDAGRAGPEELESAHELLREKEIGRMEAERETFQHEVELLRLSGALATLFTSH